jgi:hypothetical protein
VGLVEFGSVKGSLSHCSSAILSASKFIRKMRGGSQSILVQANDTKYYVVKMVGNPQGTNVLANEFLGSMVGMGVGLPVPHARGIYLSDSFIDSYPEIWFELTNVRCRPSKGIHLGILFVGELSGPGRPAEYISPSRVGTITNRPAFLGMYILDVLTNHQDNRQALFRRLPNSRDQEAIFIDHGHMFGGANWSFHERSGVAMHRERSIYSDLWRKDHVASWISHLRLVVPQALTISAPGIPSEWYKGDIEKLFDVLGTRLARLDELVHTESQQCGHLFREGRTDDALRLSNSGVHRIRTASERGAFSYPRQAALG